MAQANVISITDRQAYDIKLGNAFKTLEGDLCDMDRMAKIMASHVEDFTTDLLAGKKATAEDVDLVLFIVFETVSRAAACRKGYYERWEAAH